MGMGFALATKVDSNLTGLRYAHETSIGVLLGDGTDVWYQLDPNSYSGFGAQMTLTERTPINPARMRRKGVITDLMADAGFQMDLTKSNARDLLPGFFFAGWQDKTTLLPTAVTSAHYSVASGGASIVGGAAGSRADLIFAANWATAGNNGLKRVTASTGTTVDAAGLTAETSSATPGAIPYIRVVGVEGATGDLFITETASSITSSGALVVSPSSSHSDVLTAVVVDGGTGGTPGAVTITGTTGTGTKFQATGTIGGGGILSGPLVVTVAGDYSVEIADLNVEPVTGGSLVGATVKVTIGYLGQYIPGTDILTTVGGTGTEPTFTVDQTRVAAAARVAGGAVGEPDGSGYIVQGTTGVGTRFEASVTIASGTIASVDSISSPGHYTTNPTSLAAEPVIGLGFFISGATVSLSMGADTVVETSPGDLTIEPPDPTTTTSGGTGVGATLRVTWIPSETLGQDGAETVGITMSLKSTVLDLTTLGLQAGEWIFVGGDATANQFDVSNDNGFARILSIATHAIVVDKTASDWYPDAGSGKVIRIYFGSFLANQVLPENIVRDTLQFERTLSTGGIEYVVGCVPDMFTITLNSAAKVTCELKYVGIQTDLFEPGTPEKTGFRPLLPVSQAYNTSSDFGRLALHDRTLGSSLANFMKDATLVINNGASPVKALSRLGAIDVVVGDFQVSGAITAYFTDVNTVSAVKNNDDVTLDFALIHGNSGLLFDIPLLAVGGGRLNVVKDQPIEIPVTHSGAWDPDLNWVLSCSCYDYLPDLAQ